MFRLNPAPSAHSGDAPVALGNLTHDHAASEILGCGIDVSGRHVILAVSGGPDSMAMAQWVKTWHDQNKVAASLRAVVIDHGIRVESGDEARWVCDQLTAMGIDARVMNVMVAAPQSGLQNWAREQRYQLLARDARKDNAVVMVAHHAGDQAETIAMRLQAGSGLKGLGGMKKVSTFEDLTVLRPCLDLPQAALHHHLAQHHIPCVKDPSNRNEDFERIAIRTRLDALTEEGISPDDLRRLGRAAEALHNHLHDQIATTMAGQMGIVKAGGVWVSREALLALPKRAARLLLRDVLARIGTSRWPTSEDHTDTLLTRIAARAQQGVAATLGGLEWAVKDDLIWAYPEAELAIDTAPHDDDVSLFDERWQVRSSRRGQLAPLGASRAAAFRKAYPEIFSDWVQAGGVFQGKMMPARGLWRLPILSPASSRPDLSAPDGLIALEDGAIIPHVIESYSFKADAKAHLAMTRIKRLKSEDVF